MFEEPRQIINHYTKPIGRPKGSGNNNKTMEIKTMVLKALSMAGGEKYLYQQSQVNPVAFMGLLAKILPTQLNTQVTDQQGTTISITFAAPLNTTQHTIDNVSQAQVIDNEG